ncbi:MAG: hypothetical protein QOE90_1830 [Thermoplasmata archaeon]|jgi:hypothetical protein|nr:hypothetical protein [Thermoplasmata archaeon]
MLALEPTGELALPLGGVRLLGIESTRRIAWHALRHVFDLGEYDAGLHVEVGPFGDVLAFAVAYDEIGDELLTAL